jgi:hypothetical protein
VVLVGFEDFPFQTGPAGVPYLPTQTGFAETRFDR